MEFSNVVKSYFRDPTSTELTQLVIAFAIALLFAPFSIGLLFFIIYILVYEFLIWYFTQGQRPYFRLIMRIGIFFAALLGWVVGRLLILNKVGWEIVI